MRRRDRTGSGVPGLIQASMRNGKYTKQFVVRRYSSSIEINIRSTDGKMEGKGGDEEKDDHCAARCRNEQRRAGTEQRHAVGQARRGYYLRHERGWALQYEDGQRGVVSEPVDPL